MKMSKKKDHEKRSKWANLFNSQKLFDISLILVGVMGAAGEGHCTFCDGFDDEDLWSVHSSGGSYDTSASLSYDPHLLDFNDDNRQDITDVNFFAEFESGLEFLKEHGNFRTNPHQPQQQPVRDTLTALLEMDEHQLSITEQLEKFEEEVAGEFSTPKEEKTLNLSPAQAEAIACIEKKTRGDTPEIKAQNSNASQKTDQVEEMSQSPELRDKPREIPTLVGVTSYFTPQRIHIMNRFALKGLEGIPQQNMTLEMTKKETLDWIKGCLVLQKTNPNAGGLGFTVSGGKISAIRLYMNYQQ
jgi:hypothetical protein